MQLEQKVAAPAAPCTTRQTQWLQFQIGQQRWHAAPARQQLHLPHQYMHQQQQQLSAAMNPSDPQAFTTSLWTARRHSTTAKCGTHQQLMSAAAVASAVRPAKPGRHTQKQRHKQQHGQSQSTAADQPPAHNIYISSGRGVDASSPTSHRSSSSDSFNSASFANLQPFPVPVDSCQQQLCDVLHITASQAEMLMLTSSGAAALPRSELAANWATLQQLLPVPQHLLFQALLQVPDLLLHPQRTVSARLSEAAEVLQMHPHQLVSRQADAKHASLTPLLHWRLLLTQQHELEGKLMQLGGVLGQAAKWQQVVRVVCDEPRLLELDQTQLVSTVEALEQVCGWPLSRLLPALLADPCLLVTPAGKLYAAAAGLQQQLRLSEEGLALALRRAPAALLVPSSQLADLLQELATGLAAPTEVAADILLQEPELLLRKPGAVGGVLGVLRSTFKLGPEELLQVVQFDPFLLCRSPGDLADSTSKFKEVASSFQAWAAEYKHLMSRPVNVARALRMEPLRLLRLTYLYRQRKAASISLKAAVSMSGRQFVEVFPGYRAWLAQQYSGGNVPWQYRGPGSYDSDDEDEY